MIKNDEISSRRLSEQEHSLWSGVTRSIVPLKRKRAPTERVAVAPQRMNKAAGLTRAHPSVAVAPPPSKRVPPLVPIDRRTKQSIARGSKAIDARLDLHGRTQRQAHEALLRFLRQAQSEGARTVLVITGKGELEADLGGGRGVLKRQVPLWLALPEFRSYVLGFQDAQRGHGGQGAIYVRMRRKR